MNRTDGHQGPIGTNLFRTIHSHKSITGTEGMKFSDSKQLVVIAILISALLSGGIPAAGKPVPKPTPKKNNQASKPKASKTPSKSNPRPRRTPSKKTAVRKSKSAPPSQKDLRKMSPKERKAALAARRREEIAERRRREQAAREAEARRRAFEAALRSETVNNILSDNLDGEDLDVRRAATDALQGHAGTVVVLDPSNGKVLSIVNQEWAVRRAFKPCSTIKLVTAIAGITESRIGQGGALNDRAFPMNLDDALAFSNNSFFQAVGSGLGGQTMVSYARTLGLGQPTGINLPGETGGRVPVNNNSPRIYSHGDDFEVTPLQLAVLVSAIATNGKVVTPRVVPRSGSVPANFRTQSTRKLEVPLPSIRGVIPGMLGAAQYGTARRGIDPSFEVAGKTGSCIGGGSWLGLFASVAPIEDPKLAVVVITRGQSERGRSAAAIAGRVYSALRNRLPIKKGLDGFIAESPDLRPVNKVNATKAQSLDDAAGDDSDDSASGRRQGLVRPTGRSVPAQPQTTSAPPKENGATRPRVVGVKQP